MGHGGRGGGCCQHGLWLAQMGGAHARTAAPPPVCAAHPGARAVPHPRAAVYGCSSACARRALWNRLPASICTGLPCAPFLRFLQAAALVAVELVRPRQRLPSTARSETRRRERIGREGARRKQHTRARARTLTPTLSHTRTRAFTHASIHARTLALLARGEEAAAAAGYSPAGVTKKQNRMLAPEITQARCDGGVLCDVHRQVQALLIATRDRLAV